MTSNVGLPEALPKLSVQGKSLSFARGPEILPFPTKQYRDLKIEEEEGI